VNEVPRFVGRSKRWLIANLRRRPILHRIAKEALVGAKLVRQRVLRRDRERVHAWGERSDRYAVPFEGATIDALRIALRGASLRFAEGRHTLYIPPQPGREAVFGAELLAAFPPEAGIKVLKNFEPPSRARYQFESATASEDALLGPIGVQGFNAAALHAYELGPRPYDIVHLRGPADARGNSVDMTAIMAEHVAGGVPSEAEYEGFIAALKRLEQRGVFQFLGHSGYDNTDFARPGCSDNLIAGPSGPRYVDTQVFDFDGEKVIEDVLAAREEVLHFGDVLTVVNAGQRFLYQAVPGAKANARRGTGERWQTLDALLERHQVRFEGRAVFDICCNSGMMMHGALARGGHWAFGWDLPAVAEAADRLLPLIGAGRTTLFGRQLDLDTEFGADLPAWAMAWGHAHGGIALFLAAWHHIGFPPEIAALPWTHMIYEGSENEAEQTTAANLATMAERWGVHELERVIIRDGICGPRPVLLLARAGA
jgi:hypothetical protein